MDIDAKNRLDGRRFTGHLARGAEGERKRCSASLLRIVCEKLRSTPITVARFDQVLAGQLSLAPTWPVVRPPQPRYFLRPSITYDDNDVGKVKWIVDVELPDVTIEDPDEGRAMPQQLSPLHPRRQRQPPALPARTPFRRSRPSCNPSRPESFRTA